MKKTWARYITTCFIAASLALGGGTLCAADSTFGQPVFGTGTFNEQRKAKDSATYQSFSPAGEAGRVTSMYPVVQTDTTPATSASHYRQMAYCPDPPICVNIRGKATTTGTTLLRTYLGLGTIDPETMKPLFQGNYDPKSLNEVEINQNLFCPDQCIVTREVIIMSNKISSVKEAICPDGYAQVGSFNMQDEVIYNPTQKDMPSPILSLAQYQEYIDKGYDCSKFKNDPSNITKCSGASYWVPSTTEATFNYGLNKAYLYDGHRGAGVIKFLNIYPRGGAKFTESNGSYQNTGDTDQCFDSVAPYNCNAAHQDSCYLSCRVRVDPNETFIRCKKYADDAAYTTWYHMTYDYVRCVIPQGLVWGENKAPASVVCARKKPVFKSL